MDAKDREELGIEIRSMRDAKRMPDGTKMRQEDLARLAGVAVRTVRNLEAGRNVDPMTLGKITRALGYEAKVPKWSEDVQTFLDMIGFRLERLDDDHRAELMSEITRAVVRPQRDRPHK